MSTALSPGPAAATTPAPAAPAPPDTPRPTAGVGALPPAPKESPPDAQPTPTAPPPTPPPGEGTQTPPPGEATTTAPVGVADFKFAEGTAPDEALMGEFVPLVNEWGLKAPQAQKLVDLYAKAQAAQAAAQTAAVEAVQQRWTEAVKADAEIGGANFEKHLGFARKAIAKYGTPELTTLLESTGLGNHPDLVRFVARVGREMAEDSVAGTGNTSTASPANSEEAFQRALYPNSPQMFGGGNS